jgi:AraC-like DNA-binding protein
MPLRGGVKVAVIRPGPAHSIALAEPGAYFCICIAGKLVVRSDGEFARAEVHHPHMLHILRQPAGRTARTIEFPAIASLALLISFPPTWCSGCPRGPDCSVGRFLTHGTSVKAVAGEEAIELDPEGRAHAKALLELDIAEDADVLVAEQRVLALLAWAYARHAGPRSGGVPDSALPQRTLSKLRLAAEILGQRLDNPPTISELSSLVGMNECDLKRCFKCVYGDGIASFSRNRRLAAAQDLLAHSALSIAEIALEVGYANPSQFARAFRQQFAVNPAQFRRAPRRGS